MEEIEFDLEKLLDDCKTILQYHGIRHQIQKCGEELHELRYELMQIGSDRESLDSIITEIADVLITTLQMAIHYGLQEVVDEIQFKINRTFLRMQNLDPNH